MIRSGNGKGQLVLWAMAHVVCWWPAFLSGGEVVPWTEANQHMGKQVTVEGRVVATYASPLATLLSFDQNFSRFTVVIHPSDLRAFPSPPEEFYKGKSVKVSGVVESYRGKPQIVIRSPSQIEVTSPPPVKKEAAEEKGQRDDGMQRAVDLLTRRIAELEERVRRLEQTVGREEIPANVSRSAPPTRHAYEALRTIKRGMNQEEVVKLLGPPSFVETSSSGGSTWYYGAHRRVSFDARRRVAAFVGFYPSR